MSARTKLETFEEVYNRKLTAAEAYANLLDLAVKRYEAALEDNSLFNIYQELGEGDALDFQEIRIYMIENPTTKMKAFASMTIGGQFALRSIRVREMDDGEVSLSMPAFVRKGRKESDKRRYVDLYHPITAEYRKVMTQPVAEAYRKAKG